MLALEPMWDVVEEHLDEAEFLWGVWERSLISPNYTLDEVAEHVEERLYAHLDALALHGAAASPSLLVPALEADAHDRVCAAAAALLLGPGDAGINPVFEALRELPEQRPALVRALSCADRSDLRPRLRDLLNDFDETLVAAGAEVLLFQHEPLGEALDVLLASDDPAVRALGLRALPGEPASPKFIRAVQAALDDNDIAVVDAAIDAGVFLVPPSTWTRARTRAREPNGGRAMLLLALRSDAEARALLLAALEDAALRAPALTALSYIGAPEIVDASLEWLDEPSFGPLVGEMMSALTGVDLEDAGLAGYDLDDQEDIAHLAEDAAPQHDPILIMQWWSRERPQFRDGERYLFGRPRSLTGLLDSLALGPMRRRPALLLDLQIHAPRGVQLRMQPHAASSRQCAELAECRHRLRVCP